MKWSKYNKTHQLGRRMSFPLAEVERSDQLPADPIGGRGKSMFLGNLHHGAADRVDLGGSAALHILEHGRAVARRFAGYLFGGRGRVLEGQFNFFCPGNLGRFIRQLAHHFTC